MNHVKDKTDKCMCGNIRLSGICANDFSQWGCFLKNESSSSSSSNPSSSSSSGSGSGLWPFCSSKFRLRFRLFWISRHSEDPDY